MKGSDDFPTEGRYAKDSIHNSGAGRWFWECRLCGARERMKASGLGPPCVRGFDTKARAAADFRRNHLEVIHSLRHGDPIAPGEAWICACVKRNAAGRMTAIRENVFDVLWCHGCGSRRPRVVDAAQDPTPGEGRER